MVKNLKDLEGNKYCSLRDLPDEKNLSNILIHFREKSNCFFEGMSFWDINDRIILSLADCCGGACLNNLSGVFYHEYYEPK